MHHFMLEENRIFKTPKEKKRRQAFHILQNFKYKGHKLNSTYRSPGSMVPKLTLT